MAEDPSVAKKALVACVVFATGFAVGLFRAMTSEDVSFGEAAPIGLGIGFFLLLLFGVALLIERGRE